MLSLDFIIETQLIGEEIPGAICCICGNWFNDLEGMNSGASAFNVDEAASVDMFNSWNNWKKVNVQVNSSHSSCLMSVLLSKYSV